MNDKPVSISELKVARRNLNNTSAMLKISNTTPNWLVFKDAEAEYNRLFAAYVVQNNILISGLT